MSMNLTPRRLFWLSQLALICILLIDPLGKASCQLAYRLFSSGNYFEAYRVFKNDTSRLQQLKITADHLLADHADSSAQLYQQIANESMQSNYIDLAATGLSEVGLKYVNDGNYPQALFYLRQAYPYCTKAVFNKTLLTKYYNNIGNVCMYQGDLANATLYFLKAVKEIEKQHLKYQSGKALILSNLASIQLKLDQKQQALYYLDQAEQISKKNGFKYYAAILINKGNVYSTLKKYQAAENSYLYALKYARKDRNYNAQAGALLSLGDVLLLEQQPAKAIPYLQEGISLCDKADLVYAKISASYLLGKAYYQLKRHREAAMILAPAIQKAEQIGLKEDLLNAYTTLSEVYEAIGSDHEAILALNRAWELKDSTMGAEKTKAVNEMEIKYRTAEKDKQLAVSSLQLAKQERNLARKNLWIGGVSATTLLLSGLALGLYRSNRHKQRLQRAQIKTLEQEKDLRAMQSMIQGEEKERARMARELHDGIGGMLTSVEMHFGILEKRYEVLHEAKDYSEAMQALQDTTAEVRKTAHNLMPEMLLRHGLPEAIRIFCARVTKGEKLEIDFQNIGEVKQLEQNFELSLYRIVQELVQNIIRHAHASQALVQLSWYEDQISLLVEDNGSGLPPWEGNGTPGLGLENLNWRVKSMKGVLTIDSKQGEGTSIYIEFELLKTVGS
jgi:signal transduction histidine kinase